MRFRTSIPITVALLAAALPGCKSKDKPEPAAAAPAAQAEPVMTPLNQGPLTRTDSVEVDVTARVKAVDHASRMMTLVDEAGNEVTFAVSNSVQRLNEVMVGDNVRARYSATLLAELRSPTVEELNNPVAYVDAGGRSQGSTPAAGAFRAVRVVTTVAAVDTANMLVTLRGPMGDTAVTRGRNPDNVRRLRVGDTIVITYAETVGIALEKLAPR